MSFNELFIDVSELEQPDPFEKVTQLLGTMKKGEYVCMLHRKKPLPLIQMLLENGFDCIVRPREQALWEIIIWYKKDSAVGQFCLSHFPV